MAKVRLLQLAGDGDEARHCLGEQAMIRKGAAGSRLIRLDNVRWHMNHEMTASLCAQANLQYYTGSNTHTCIET